MVHPIPVNPDFWPMVDTEAEARRIAEKLQEWATDLFNDEHEFHLAKPAVLRTTDFFKAFVMQIPQDILRRIAKEAVLEPEPFKQPI